MTRAAGDPAPSVSRGQLTSLLAAARREYVLEARRGNGGREVQAGYADRMDAIVGALVGAAQALTSRRLVVCALGGYGRRTLCLHSDVDLLILFDGEIARDEERFVNAVLQPLWDLQLVVGHHIRELAELDTPDPENTEFMTALLDARPIAGDATLFERVRERTALSAESRAHVVDALLGLVEQRHGQFNDTLYQLEPDIKNAPGGLRDIAITKYLRALEPGAFDVESPRAVESLRDGRGVSAARPFGAPRRERPRRERADA